MKRLLVLLIFPLFITASLGAWTASGSTAQPGTPRGFGCGLMGPNGDHDGDGISNRLDPDFLAAYHPLWTKNIAGTTIATTTCPNVGNGYGDGTHPQPRDGTGFGARAHARGKKANTCCIGQGEGPRQGLGQGLGRGLGRCNGMRRRDGSCLNATSTQKIGN